MRKQVITHPISAQALRPVADQSLNTVIGDRLKDFILREKLRPGDKLPAEGVLAERLQVSRTAIREAMRGLEALGMVEARQGSGRVVRDFNFDAILDSLTYGMVFHSHTIRQVTEVRKALDAFFADHMVANVSDADLAALDDLVADIQRLLRDGKTYEDDDYAFHRRLFEIAGNPLALQLFRITWEVRMSTGDPTFWQPPRSRSEVAIHANIVKALRARDAAATRMAMLAHYAYTDGLLAKKLAAEAAGMRETPSGRKPARNGTNGKHA